MNKVLVVMPSVRASKVNENVYLDIKMVEGIRQYAKLWNGPVRCLLRISSNPIPAYSQIYDLKKLPFELVIIPDRVNINAGAFEDAGIILASGDNHMDLKISGESQAPVVYIIEYTLETRLKIAAIDQASYWRRFKTMIWTLSTERHRRNAFLVSAGLQCNGTPAFDRYRQLSRAPLLYFDTRTTLRQHIRPDMLAEKQEYILSGEPLRLAFSGRLEPMKGADHLIQVAAALRRQQVPFKLTIFGEGSLRSQMGEDVIRHSLQDYVYFAGSVSFEETLLPTLAKEIDLFICCHRQADPSCTYLETFSAGVAIAGYDNKAFEGILALGDAGVKTPVDNPNLLAAAVNVLHQDRSKLVDMVQEAARISLNYNFESVFHARIDHLKRVLEYSYHA